jgi:hypothetical protein
LKRLIHLIPKKLAMIMHKMKTTTLTKILICLIMIKTVIISSTTKPISRRSMKFSFLRKPCLK